MSRLDEIEARIGRTMGGITFPHTLGQDTQLLIRAVRQLGAVTRTAIGVRDEEVRWTDKATSLNLTIESLDPDVLALIDKPISVVANDGPEQSDR